MDAQEVVGFGLTQLALVVVLLHLAFRSLAQSGFLRSSPDRMDEFRRELMSRLHEAEAIARISSDQSAYEFFEREFRHLYHQLSHQISQGFRLLTFLRIIEAVFVYTFGARLLTVRFGHEWRDPSLNLPFELHWLLYGLVSIHIIFVSLVCLIFFWRRLAMSRIGALVEFAVASSKPPSKDASLEQVLSDKLGSTINPVNR